MDSIYATHELERVTSEWIYTYGPVQTTRYKWTTGKCLHLRQIASHHRIVATK